MIQAGRRYVEQLATGDGLGAKLIRGVVGGGMRGQLLRGGIGSLGLKIINKVLMLLVAVVLARVMGPENFGVYSFVLAVLMTLAIPVQMGLPTLVVRETAKAAAGADFVTIGTLWHWSTRAILIIGGLVLIIGWVVLWLTQGWIAPIRALALAVGLPTVLLVGLNAVRASALRGLRHVVWGQITELLVKPAVLLIAVLIVVLPFNFGLTPSLAVILNMAAVAVSFIVCATLLRYHQPTGLCVSKPSYELRKSWLVAILPLALISGMAFANKNIDLILLGVLGTNEQVGIYRVAMQGALLVLFGEQALNQLLAPYFADVYARGQHNQLQRLATIGAIATTMMALAAAVLFWLFGPILLRFVFGTDYLAAYLPLCILAAALVLHTSMGQLGILLQMTGGERQVMLGLALAVAGNVLLNIVFIPPFGMIGAALATCCGLIIENCTLWFFVRQRLGVKPSVLAVLRQSN